MKMETTFAISVWLMGLYWQHIFSTNAYTSGHGVHPMDKLKMKLTAFASVSVGEDLCLK